MALRVEAREVQQLLEQPTGGGRPARTPIAQQLLAQSRSSQLSGPARTSVLRTPYTEVAGVRSSCEAIATKFSFSWSSSTVSSWSRARSIAIATRVGDELQQLDVVVR